MAQENPPQTKPKDEDVNEEEHWVYLSQLEEAVAYSLKSGGNRVVIRILPDPFRFSV
jgi:hypothetical protein